MKSGKIWGTTEVLLRTPFLEVHRLVIFPKAHCSLHKHLYKHNSFFVAKGRLMIEVHKSDYNLVDITDLGPGEFTTVKPNDLHSFMTGPEGCTAIEMYYPEPLSEDIIRQNVGGRL